jgi:outer membrane protein TolC
MFYGLRDQQDYSYSLGVEGSIPIPNRSARGQHRRARFNEEQALKEYQQTELQLMTAVRNALRAVETNKVLIEANEQSRRLQEANVIAEEKSLRLGASTSFEVLRVQEDLTNAQLAELQAMIDFEQALVDLRLAEGTLLEEMGIAFEAPKVEDEAGFIDSVIPREFDF